MPDLGGLLGLVVPGGIDGEFAEKLAAVAEDAHVAVGDQKPDGLVFEGAADADVEQAVHVAEGDLAFGADPVLADAAVHGRHRSCGMRLESGVEGNQRCGPVQRAVRTVVVVVGAESVELQLEHRQ